MALLFCCRLQVLEPFKQGQKIMSNIGNGKGGAEGAKDLDRQAPADGSVNTEAPELLAEAVGWLDESGGKVNHPEP